MNRLFRSSFKRVRAGRRAQQADDTQANRLAAERSAWLELSASAEAFALFDHDHRLVLWNPAFSRALSLPPGSLIQGAYLANLLGAGVRPSELHDRQRHALDNWLAALTPPPSGHRAPASYRMSNGRWLRVRSQRTLSGGIILHLVDITESKTQELALRAAQAELAVLAEEKKEGFASLARRHQELREAMKEIRIARDETLRANEAQLQFLTKVSHEFRTPLNAIIGFSEFMAKGLGGPIGTPRYQGYAENIAESGHQLLGLVDRMLDFTKADADELHIVRRPVDLESVVSSCCLQFAYAASQSGALINVELKAPRWPVLEADETRLRQILTGFLSNAVKASAKGGAIRLRIAEAEGKVWLMVADQGPGMTRDEIKSASTLPHLRVEAAPNATSGLGLGLPLTHSLVALHGGRLSIHSRVGRGTVAAAIIPLAARDAKPFENVTIGEPGRIVPLR